MSTARSSHARALAFIRDTQPELWAEMSALHGANLESTLIETLVKELDNKGSLHVLRHGFRFFGKTFRLAYFKPSHGLNPDALARFARNELTVTRQARCHPGEGRRGRPPLRAQRRARRHLRAEEPDDRAVVAQRGPPVPAGSRPERALSSASRSAPSSTSPPTRKRST